MTKKRLDRIRSLGYDAYMSSDHRSYMNIMFFASRRTRKAFLEGWRRAEHKIYVSAHYGKDRI